MSTCHPITSNLEANRFSSYSLIKCFKMVSWVWSHFVKNGPGKATCRKCNRIILTTGGSTRAMANHLNNVHKIFENKVNEESPPESSSSPNPAANSPSASPAETQAVPRASTSASTSPSQPPVKVQRTIPGLLKYRSLEETVARLAAESNFTIKQITTTPYLRQCLSRDFSTRTIPKNQTDMLKLIMRFYEEAKQKTILEIKKLSETSKFSTTLDEWTSLRNTRYLNVNLHYTSDNEAEQKHINLGLVAIDGSLPSEELLVMVSFHSWFGRIFDLLVN